MIDHETVLVDPTAWTIDSVRYDYYNGGHITMTQTFRDVGGYSMLAEQHAEIAIPYAKAVAYGSYSDYKTNVAIDDNVATAARNTGSATAAPLPSPSRMRRSTIGSRPSWASASACAGSVD